MNKYFFTTLRLLLILLHFQTLNAQCIKLFDFSDSISGKEPDGSLISDGVFLYGMTEYGGVNNHGTMFKIKKDGSGYEKLLDFGGAIGSYPKGSFYYDGTYLYGTTTQGGLIYNGTIFKIKTDGTDYLKLLDFDGYTTGSYPDGELISDGTFLYGVTSGGGINYNGTIFKIKPDGTNYTKLTDFTTITNGTSPRGKLVWDGTHLYGMTYDGGVNYHGVIYKILPDGTAYQKLLDFSGLNGLHPFGSLTSDGTFLYGMTYWGGSSTSGNIFKIKPDGSGYVNLWSFTGGSTNGAYPRGDLMLDGNLLYGMTSQGGTNTDGVVFKIKTDGTGYATLWNLQS
jgi:uncharacterized repeat protein (TIGR03803 family)